MVDVGPFTSTGDIALIEIIQGKLTPDYDSAAAS